MVVIQWAQNIKAGRTVTVLADVDGEVVGYASVHNDQVSWQRHLGELRIQVGPAYRGCGLGGLLGKEIFAIASDLGIEKIVAQMTADQRQAIALVERHGFKQEAVLHDFVIGRDGRKNDLVVMGCHATVLPPDAARQRMDPWWAFERSRSASRAPTLHL